MPQLVSMQHSRLTGGENFFSVQSLGNRYSSLNFASSQKQLMLLCLQINMSVKCHEH